MNMNIYDNKVLKIYRQVRGFMNTYIDVISYSIEITEAALISIILPTYYSTSCVVDGSESNI